MTSHTYYMDDASMAVPTGFIDRTAHLLEWSVDGGGKVALVVNREELPKVTASEAPAGAFDRYVTSQTKVYPSQFAGFHLERDEATAADSSFDMRRKVFRWRHEQDVIYHNQVFVLVGPDVLVFTASAKAADRDVVDRVLDGALASLRVRGPEEYR